MSSYLLGPGSCQGDSGGPLFTHTINDGKDTLVLLGITSKGHSNIGNCGGIDNPTHYVRIKKMMSWIKRYIKTEEMCIVKSRISSDRVKDSI